MRVFDPGDETKRRVSIIETLLVVLAIEPWGTVGQQILSENEKAEEGVGMSLQRFVQQLIFFLCIQITVSYADTLVYNVQGYTLKDNVLANFSYLHFDDAGRVVAAGDGRLPSATTRIDGRGSFMLPGLIDAHGHIESLGFTRLQVDLVGTRSLEEALGRIKAYAQSHADLPWVLGRGWNQELWTIKEFPSASDLDNIVSDKPVWLRRIDGHAGWANTAALTIAEIDTETPNPLGGSIHRDKSGKATGILVDNAMDIMSEHIPDPSPDIIVQALELAFESLNRVGLTGAHDAGVTASLAHIYQKLDSEGKLPVRIYAMLAGIENVNAWGKPYRSPDGKLQVRSMKLVADGALGSRGAALFSPYSDDPDNLGLPFYESTEDLTAEISAAREKGFQVNVHAIGTKANHMVLDAMEAAGVKPGERNRDEHAQIVLPDDISRFKTLGILPSMQPTHATSDMNMAEKRLGKARIAGAYAWRTFLDQGSKIPAGSDFPVESPNPFWGLYSAVTRRDHAYQPPAGWYPEQAMSRVEAFRAFTLDAAYGAFMEDEVGSLEAGKWADFILVDRDYFRIPEKDIYKIQTLETWVGGKRVWPG